MNYSTLGKGMLAAGVLASYLAFNPASVQAQSRPVYETSVPTEKTHGLIVNSNRDPVLAQLAIESLKNAGMTDAFIYKVKIESEIRYRIVVPFGKESFDEIKGEVAKLPQFDSKRAYVIPLIIRDTKGKRTTLEGKISETNASFERNMSRQSYVSKIAPYIKGVHDSYYKRDKKVLSADVANQVVGYIYDASKEFKAPLMRATAIYLHESKGDPFALGDLDKAPNIAIGPFQTRVNTIDYALKNMKANGVKNLPDTVEEASIDLRTLVRIGVWYLSNNLDRKNTDLALATKRFNAGHNSRNPKNEGYLNKVTGEEQRMQKAILK